MLKKTKKICQENGIVPTRTKGQNFLVNEEIYDDIVKFADFGEKDTVLEVGPGLGFLTEKLAERAGKVVAVELDDKLFLVLQERLKGVKNLKVFHDNVLDMRVRDWKLEARGWKIVANLPYNITSIFLRKIFELENKPKSLVLMLQKEVAERIVARPGKMSLLAVSVQFYAEAEIVQYVQRGDFWPVPEVDSAVVKMIINNEKLIINNLNIKKNIFVKVHNSLRVGDLIEIVRPGYDIMEMKVEKMYDVDTKESVKEAHGGQEKTILLEVGGEVPEYSVIRRKL